LELLDDFSGQGLAGVAASWVKLVVPFCW